MMLWQRRMAELGGVASAADLHRMGLTDVEIRLFATYRSLQRVRVGWYVTPDVPDLVREAVRLGGRLTCLSALRHRGAPVLDDGRLHIELPANAVLRPAAVDRARVRVHWARHPSPGDRATVGMAAAWGCARVCGAIANR